VVSVYNNSVDHFGGHTFGCHENYFVEMEEDFYAVQIPKVMAFLVTRQIFAGTGRVGGHVLVDDLVVQGPNRTNPNIVDTIWVGHAYGVVPDPSVKFQLSQRADHILKGVAGRVRFNRAMINPKWETFYSYMGRQRLHVLFGESNMMEFAYALKVGTTSLVLRLIEEGKLRDVPRLGQPVDALRSISRDPTLRWACQLWTGETTSAIEVQRRYLDLCGAFANESGETDWVLSNWSDTLDQLERDPMALADRLDWVAKKKIIEDYALSQGLELDHDTLHSIDLEYHNIDEDKGLFYALQQMGETVRVIDDLDATIAMTKPPENTRAKARAEIVRRIVDSRSRGYGIDWDGVAVSANEVYDLPNPFDTEVPTPRS
jgi:proteasome accessory factor A